MKDLVRILLALLVAFIGWNAGARLQVFERAVLVDQEAKVYRGRISRGLLHGDWVIETGTREHVRVPNENFGALSFQGSEWNLYAVSALLASFAAAIFVALPGGAGRLWRTPRAPAQG